MKDFARKRLDKARRALAAAHRELGAGNPDFAADRAYYATFYAAEALLAERQLRYRSHAAVQGAFGLHLVKSGAIDASHHRTLLDAFEARHVAVYGMDPELTSAQALELMRRVQSFVDAASDLLRKEAEGTGSSD